MKLSLFRLNRKTTFLVPLFLNESARSLSISFLSFFSVIFIYKKFLGLSGDKVLAFVLTFSFFVVLQVFKIIGTFLAENLALRIGLKKQMVFGYLLTIFTFSVFFFSQNNLSFLLVASIFWGLAIGFYWFGYYGLLSKKSANGYFGEALGLAGVITNFLAAGVPFFGGFLVSRFGYQALFLTALIFLFLGIFPLLVLKDEKTHQDIFFKEILKLIFSHKKIVFTYFSLGACGEIYSLALILYVFLFLGQELFFGEFFSLSLLLVAVFNLLIGKWTDAKGKRNLVYYGAFISSLVWFGRFLAKNISPLFVFDVIDRVSGGMLKIPLTVLTFEKALDGQSTARALVFREMAITSGAIFGEILLIIFVFLGFSLRVSFLVASFLMLTSFLISRKTFLK